MDAQARQAAFMSALVTEHFVLQSAASTTVSEASGRASLYLSVLSSSLVAMGFAGQSPGLFVPFAAAVIPAILVLGMFTVVRLVDTGVQNVRFLAGIARIRGYYRTLSPEAGRYFTPWGEAARDDVDQDEADQALASLSRRRNRLTSLGTTASMIAAINSILAGIGAALAFVWAAGRDSIVVAVLLGLVVVAVGMLVFFRYQYRRYQVLHTSTP